MSGGCCVFLLLICIVGLSFVASENAEPTNAIVQLLRAKNFSVDVVGRTIVKGVEEEEPCHRIDITITEFDAAQTDRYENLCKKLRAHDTARNRRQLAKIVTGVAAVGIGVTGKLIYDKVMQIYRSYKLDYNLAQNDLERVFLEERATGYIYEALEMALEEGAPAWITEASNEVIPFACDARKLSVHVCKKRDYATLINVLPNGEFSEDGTEFNYIDISPFHIVDASGVVLPVGNCEKCHVGNCFACEIDDNAECSFNSEKGCAILTEPVTKNFVFERAMVTGHLIATNLPTMKIVDGENEDNYKLQENAIIKLELPKNEVATIGSKTFAGISTRHELETAKPQRAVKVQKRRRHLEPIPKVGLDPEQMLRLRADTSITRIVIRQPTFWQCFWRRFKRELVWTCAAFVVCVVLLIFSCACTRSFIKRNYQKFAQKAKLVLARFRNRSKSIKTSSNKNQHLFQFPAIHKTPGKEHIIVDIDSLSTTSSENSCSSQKPLLSVEQV